MSEPIISVSGLRGIVGETLTGDVAVRYAAAFAAMLPPAGTILIGRDSRPSGEMLVEAIQAGLQAAGHGTLDAGIVATPTVGVLVRHCRAAAGIAVTASHNPLPYNGVKLFSAEGRVVPAEMGQQVLTRYRSGEAPRPSPASPGTRQTVADSLSSHLEAVLATVDVEGIRGCRFQVVLDSNHGAGSPLGRRLLEALGCRVTLLGEATDGQFQHTPEPTAENLAGVLAAVPAAGAGLGVLPGPRRRSASGDRPRGPLPGRRVYRGPVCRARTAAAAGTDRRQLRQQPHVRGRRPAATACRWFARRWARRTSSTR